MGGEPLHIFPVEVIGTRCARVTSEKPVLDALELTLTSHASAICILTRIEIDPVGEGIHVRKQPKPVKSLSVEYADHPQETQGTPPVFICERLGLLTENPSWDVICRSSVLMHQGYYLIGPISAI
jgi:hypothetical protein